MTDKNRSVTIIIRTYVTIAGGSRGLDRYISYRW